MLTDNCIEKTKIKIKEAGYGPFLKNNKGAIAEQISGENKK